jgi:hypothetical protein
MSVSVENVGDKGASLMGIVTGDSNRGDGVPENEQLSSHSMMLDTG